MQFLEPDKVALRDRCSRGSSVVVSAPFFSEKALAWVRPGGGGRLEFWTRLNPYDWVAGVADPKALLRFAKEEVGTEHFTLFVNPRLHAKFYLVDDAWAWVGSANLSSAAFGDQMELLCETDDPDHVRELGTLVGDLRRRMATMSLPELSNFVDATEDVVMAARDREKGELEDENMAAAVALMDEIVAPSPSVRVSAAVRHPLTEFIEFLEEKGRRLQIAEKVLQRHAGESNLQGHVKQTYYGALLFLLQPENRRWAQRLASQSMREPNLLPSDHDLQERWIRFLDANAGIEDERLAFRFSTLRTILPETWGGYQHGGGGGIGTLKRVLPLTARFLQEKGYLNAG